MRPSSAPSAMESASQVRCYTNGYYGCTKDLCRDLEALRIVVCLSPCTSLSIGMRVFLNLLKNCEVALCQAKMMDVQQDCAAERPKQARKLY